MTHGGAHEKTYEKIGIKGAISKKQRRETGVTVVVVKTEDSETPNYPSKYFTQCLSHRAKKGWSTRSKAIKGARVPASWCKRCAERKAEQDAGEEE
tara:strand:- start:23 stop:310 length:288 start_codon:yes stop_codon:yes gene_type:complete